MSKGKLNDKAFEKKFKRSLFLLGGNLYKLRKDRKESLETVAKAIKRSPRYISKIEKGAAYRVKIGIIIELCAHYKVKLQDVVPSEKRYRKK